MLGNDSRVVKSSGEITQFNPTVSVSASLHQCDNVLRNRSLFTLLRETEEVKVGWRVYGVVRKIDC